MYQPTPVTGRIQRLRSLYKSLPVASEKRPYYYSQDRWISLGFLESWADPNRGLTTRLRLANANAAELDVMEPVIYDDELIVGHLYFPVYSEEEQAKFNELYEKFQFVQTAYEPHNARADHLMLDYEKLLRVGVNGLIEEIEGHMASLALANADISPDDDIVGRYEYYECLLIELKALQRLAGRYEKHARFLAANSEEPRKSELLSIANIMASVPLNPAHTFREAVQSVHFYTFNLFGLYPLGRPDRYLYPYYKRDIEKGIITPEEAQELIDQLCLLVSTYVFSRAACGFMVGGTDADGLTVENELTFMFLTALEHIYMPDPNGALAMTTDTSDELLSYAADILGKGITHPAFYNDRVIVESLMRYGIKEADAHNYIHTTCAEISIVGKSRMYTTSYVADMPAILMELLSGGHFMGIDDILNAYIARLAEFVHTQNLRYHLRIREAGRNGLEPFRAGCLVDDCIARGKDVYEGGAVYSMQQPIFIGFSNAVDSLLAIEHVVFSEHMHTLSSFLEIVKQDYQDSEPLRQYIIHRCPHYGNDIPHADELAKRLASGITAIFHRKDIYGVKYAMPGTFSYVNHATAGARFGATPDGRCAHTSYADGCGPVQGYDTNGPTALINSLTSWDQSDFLAGMVVNLKLGKSTFKEEKKHNFIRLLRTFIQRGGLEMQVNVVNADTLKDAVVHPEQHRDLIVRIGGFSDYFVKQTAAMQQEIIKRREY